MELGLLRMILGHYLLAEVFISNQLTDAQIGGSWEAKDMATDNNDGVKLCLDEHEDCSVWAFADECIKNPEYMLTTCVESCGWCNSGFYPQPRIVGGVTASHGEFPSIIRISYSGNHHCGGVIVHPRLILSAAHCFDPDDSNSAYAMIAGDHRVGYSDGTEQIRFVERIVNHPDYNPLTKEHDIALVLITGAFQYGRYVNYASISPNPAIPGELVTVAGWGSVQYRNPFLPSTLMKVSIYIVSQYQCRMDYAGKNRIPEGMICAASAGKDSCSGDSGGPLYRSNGDLVGLVSWGEKCALPGYPGVYTDTTKYYNFIRGTFLDLLSSSL